MKIDKLGRSRGIAVDKLCEPNFHVRKQKINPILTYRKVDHVISPPNTHREGTVEHMKRIQCDKLARAIIGLSLSDDMMDHVRDVASANQICKIICNVIQRHSLLNKFRARRNFYTVKMRSGKKMLPYINCIQQLGQVLKAMEVNILLKRMALAILCQKND